LEVEYGDSAGEEFPVELILIEVGHGLETGFNSCGMNV